MALNNRKCDLVYMYQYFFAPRDMELETFIKGLSDDGFLADSDYSYYKQTVDYTIKITYKIRFSTEYIVIVVSVAKNYSYISEYTKLNPILTSNYLEAINGANTLSEFTPSDGYFVLRCNEEIDAGNVARRIGFQHLLNNSFGFIDNKNGYRYSFNATVENLIEGTLLSDSEKDDVVPSNLFCKYVDKLLSVVNLNV